VSGFESVYHKANLYEHSQTAWIVLSVFMGWKEPGELRCLWRYLDDYLMTCSACFGVMALLLGASTVKTIRAPKFYSKKKEASVGERQYRPWRRVI
jgi:hypothetical protein